MLKEDRILDFYDKGIKLKSNRPNRPEIQFTLKDLIGEKIVSVRKIFRGRNKNPDFLDILDFESGRILITGVEGVCDGSIYHQYLVERDCSVKYSYGLFENYDREIKLYSR